MVGKMQPQMLSTTHDVKFYKTYFVIRTPILNANSCNILTNSPDILTEFIHDFDTVHETVLH